MDNVFISIVYAFLALHLVLGIAFALAASEYECGCHERMDGVEFIKMMLVWEYFIFIILHEVYFAVCGDDNEIEQKEKPA